MYFTIVDNHFDNFCYILNNGIQVNRKIIQCMVNYDRLHFMKYLLQNYQLPIGHIFNNVIINNTTISKIILDYGYTYKNYTEDGCIPWKDLFSNNVTTINDVTDTDTNTIQS